MTTHPANCRLADPFSELFGACANGLAESTESPHTPEYQAEVFGNLRALKLATFDALITLGTLLSERDGDDCGAGLAVVHLTELLFGLDVLERDGRQRGCQAAHDPWTAGPEIE